MLETPLYGRFQGENRRLAFLAPAPYHVLVRTCTIGGALSVLYGQFGDVLGFDPPIYAGWWVMTGLLVAVAGALAAYSLQSIVFDLRERTYRRCQGPGMFPTATSGRIDDLDAIVLIAEPNGRIMQNGVTYHLALHWKNGKEPSMVLQNDTRSIIAGQPLNLAAQPLLQKGMQFASALKLPFYDNSHFASANPVSLFR